MVTGPMVELTEQKGKEASGLHWIGLLSSTPKYHQTFLELGPRGFDFVLPFSDTISQSVWKLYYYATTLTANALCSNHLSNENVFRNFLNELFLLKEGLFIIAGRSFKLVGSNTSNEPSSWFQEYASRQTSQRLWCSQLPDKEVPVRSNIGGAILNDIYTFLDRPYATLY